MAKIPLYSGQQVQLDNLPNARQQIATPDGAFGATQAAQSAQLAKGLGDLGEGIARADRLQQQAVLRAQQEADQVRVDDALNQLRETEMDLTFDTNSGYTALQGVAALNRPDNKPLHVEYLEKLQKRYGEIEKALGNDNQRTAFRLKANDRMVAFKGTLQNYEGDQFRRYETSVSEGTIATATRQLALFYNDPDKVDDSVLSIQAAAARRGRSKGLAANEIAADTEKLVSAAHIGAIDHALANNQVLEAEKYLRRYGKQMTLKDLIDQRDRIDKKVAEQIGSVKATEALTGVVQAATPNAAQAAVDITFGPQATPQTAPAAPAGAAPAVDRKAPPAPAVEGLPKGAVEVTMSTESGGNRYAADGKTLLTSPKGAKGEMQVMDATMRDPGYGVKPAQDNSPEERARVGRDYLAALAKRYAGNMAFTWAAYNYGPPRFEKLMRKLQKEGKQGQWTDYLPAETRNYVATNMRKLAAVNGGAGSTAAAPAARVPSYEDGKARLMADPVLKTRPLALKEALEQYDRKWADHQKGVKINQDNALAEAMRHIDAGGSYKSLSEQLKAGIDPTRFDELRNYEKQVKGNGTTTDLAYYQQLTENPERVRKMSDAEFYGLRTKLSEADFKKFAALRAPKEEKAKDNRSGVLDMTGINQVLKSRFDSMGLNAKSSDDKMRMGAITRHVQDLILAEQKKLGKQLDNAQTLKLIDAQFLRTRAFKESGWFSGEGVRKEQLFGMRMKDIPADSLKRLKKDFEAQGIKAPTDQQLLQAYYEADFTRPNARR